MDRELIHSTFYCQLIISVMNQEKKKSLDPFQCQFRFPEALGDILILLVFSVQSNITKQDKGKASNIHIPDCKTTAL